MKNRNFGKVIFAGLSLVKKTLHIALFLPLFYLAAEAQTAVGYIQEIKGIWYLSSNPSQSLRQGQKLPSASVIKRQSSSSDDRITVSNLRGEIIVGASRRCWEQDCSGGIKIPNSSPKKGYLGEAYDSVMGLIWGSPSKYSIHRSRAGEELLDGIAKFEAGKIDLSRILQKQAKYNLRWRTIPLSENEKVGEWIETTGVELRDINPPIAVTEKLKPGLYEVNLLTARGETLQGTQNSAWVLIAEPSTYEKNISSLQTATKMTEKWGENVSETNVKVFMRAYLENLARQNNSTEKK